MEEGAEKEKKRSAGMERRKRENGKTDALGETATIQWGGSVRERGGAKKGEMCSFEGRSKRYGRKRKAGVILRICISDRKSVV